MLLRSAERDFNSSSPVARFSTSLELTPASLELIPQHTSVSPSVYPLMDFLRVWLVGFFFYPRLRLKRGDRLVLEY